MHYKLNEESFKDKLKSLNERDFRLILIQLFEKMNFQDVDHNHGPTEFGKDIVFYEEDTFGQRIWHSCVVKAGDVNQSTLSDVNRQVRESFKSKYSSITHGKVKINEVLVICSGVYKGNSKTLIAEELEDREKGNIIFWQQNQVVQYLKKFKLTNLIVHKNQNILLTKYNEKMLSEVLQNKSLKFLQTDFDVNINNFEDFKLTIKARSSKFEKEREEYLEGRTKKIPVKFLPDIKNIIDSGKHFFLHGIATSGKSTILKTIGKEFISSKPNSIAFYIELNKLKNDTNTGISELTEKIYRKLTNHDFDLTEFKNERLLLLLDGLDEVQNEDLRKKIVNEIKALNLSEFDIQIILSSRTADIVKNDPDLNKIFDQFELMSLNLNELVKVGERIINDEEQTKSFVNLVSKGEIVNAFPKTPLTSILLAILFKEDKIDPKDLPRNITELYEKFMDLFMDKWDKERGVSQQYKLKERMFVLREVAKKMHKANSIEIKKDELLLFLDNLKSERPVEILENSEGFLENLSANSNILIYNSETKRFRFFHLTIQEYLASLSFGTQNEEFLSENILNEWWLNPSIFYAGKNPENESLVVKLSHVVILPTDMLDKSTYIIHLSKVLKAAHLISNEKRRSALVVMIKLFDQMLKDLIKSLIGSQNPKFYKRTILDVILYARSFYMDYMSSKQFFYSQESIWTDKLFKEDKNLSDITKYCIAYDLSVSTNEAKYLLQFVSDNSLNVRWNKIVNVDINIKNLNHNRRGKPILKLKQSAVRNKDYIAKQFNEKISKHYKTITSIDN